MSDMAHDQKQWLGSKKEHETQEMLRPAVVSVSRRYLLDTGGVEARELTERISQILEELATLIRKDGGFIGHIKAFVSTPDGAALGFSVVRDRAQLLKQDFAPQEPIMEFTLALTAIVYKCGYDELNCLVELGLDKCLTSV